MPLPNKPQRVSKAARAGSRVGPKLQPGHLVQIVIESQPRHGH
jgi:hypothetical protein